MPEDTQTPIKVSKAEIDTMVDVAQHLGVKLEIKQLSSNMDEMFIDGKVIVSTHALQPTLQVFKHELTHHIEGTKEYPALLELVEQYYKYTNQSIGSRAQDIRIEYEKYGKTLNWEEMQREVVAEFVGKYLFTNKKAIQSLSNKSPNMAKRIWEWIKRFCAYFKKDSIPSVLMDAEYI